MNDEDRNVFLRRPDNPNYLHRCRHHDYHRPARYMITLSKSDRIAPFSRIDGSPASPCIELSSTGRAFEAALRQWRLLYPEIEVAAYQIMPDHIHLCIDVGSCLKTGLSRAIASLMGRTTAAIRANDGGVNTVSAFAKGFNDRIAFNTAQWERQKRYVVDNPRRYLIKRLYPDLFYRRWIVEIAGEKYMAAGNIMLLKNPDIQVVRFSRRYKEGEFEAKRESWAESVRTGGVLVSPFIHPEEKAVREATLKTGGAVIRVCENGFPDRFCSQGEEFKYVGSRQLLLIAPMLHNTQKDALTYGRAQSLNRIAERIAAGGLSGVIKPYR